MSPSPIPSPVPFDLAQTLDCGQAFRWVERSPGEWEALPSEIPPLSQQGEGVLFHCSPKDYEETWRPYFDLNADYAAKRAALSRMGPALREAAAFAPASASCGRSPGRPCAPSSSPKTTTSPGIKGILHRLCEAFGQPIGTPAGRPSPPPSAWPPAISRTWPPCGRLPGQYLLDAAQKVASGAVTWNRSPPPL